MEDHELLRQFFALRSEQAFAELVRRHIHLVYSSALRQVRDSAEAEDVTQSVFVLLAQRAPKIRGVRSLSGWLLSATRGVALNSLRGEARRRRHECEAATMKRETNNSTESNWKDIKCCLDEAMAALGPKDRDVLTLRYFQNCEMPQVAAALGISSSAAQKRISRAMIRLRKLFAERGIAASPIALASELASNAVTPAPTALSSKVVQSALAPTHMPTPKSVTKGLTRFKIWTPVKIAGFLIIAAGVGIPLLQNTAAPVGSGSAAAAASEEPVSALEAVGGASNWEAEFRRVYALNDGEIVRHIAAPFIAERLDFLATVKLPRRLPSANSCYIDFDGKDFHLELVKAPAAEHQMATALRMVAGIWPQETDLPRAVLRRDAEGDWVYRSSADVNQKLAALTPLILGEGKTFKLLPRERSVIVASGTFAYTSIVTRPVARALTFNDIFLTEPMDFRDDLINFVGTQTDLMHNLGEITGIPIVIDGDLGPPQLLATIAPASMHLASPYAHSAPDQATVDKLLDLVSQQTSLTFKREKRTVPTWCLVDADK